MRGLGAGAQKVEKSMDIAVDDETGNIQGDGWSQSAGECGWLKSLA